MTKLEDRIRTGLQGVAGQLAETGTIPGIVAEDRTPARLRGPLVAVVAMVTVLVLLGGSLVLLATLGTPSDEDAAATQQERFPIAGYVPATADTVGGAYAVPDPANPDAVAAVIARPTADGFEAGTVVTVYGSGYADEFGIPPGESVVLDGDQASLIRSKGTVSLWWQEGDYVVSVRSPGGDADLAESVAASVRIDVNGAFTAGVLSFAALPDGLTMFAAPRLASPEPRAYVMLREDTGPNTNEPLFAQIMMYSEPIEQVAGALGSGTRVSVDGFEGYLTEKDGEATVVWSPFAGVVVTTGGTFPAADIERIAEGIEFVTEDEWREHYDVVGPQLPTTTIPNPAPSADASHVGSAGPGSPTTTIP
jgi:hypothetical protein